MHPLVNIAVSAVRQASRINLQAMDKVNSSTKKPLDFVSTLQEKTEQILIDVIKAAYPKHTIAAKQGGKIDGDEITWLVDALDGTTNFLSEIPNFTVTIAIIEKGRVQHSVIYDGVRDELFTASRGRGAAVNGKRLRVKDQKVLNKCMLGTGFPYPGAVKGDIRMGTFTDFISQCKDLRLTGTPSLDLAYVAAGRLDGFWQFGLTEWEIAAGSLMILEAGGIVDDMNGRQKYMTSGNVIAAAPKVFKVMAKTIQPHLK